MVRFGKGLFLLLAFFSFAGSVLAQQTIYDLRKLNQQQWLSMSTEERMTALSTSMRQVENQTFVGRFNANGGDLYKRWGYDYYEMNDSYENYAFRRPESYNILNERRHRWSYNMFGDRIPYVRNTFYVWQESYFKLGTSSITSADSLVNGTGFTSTSKDHFLNAVATDAIDGVWVVKETTDDWGASAVFAASLRNNYTPLTMQLPNIPGLRIDFQSANNSASVVNAIMLGMSGRGLDGYWSTGGVILRGGRFQRKFGALTLGTTYANQYIAQGNRIGHDSWYGTASTNTYSPMYLAVRVLDDSPNDGEGGPTVRDIRLKLNGKYRDDIQPTAIIDDVTRDETTLITNASYNKYLSPSNTAGGSDAPEFDLLIDERMPKYADYLYYLAYLQGQNSTKITTGPTFANFEKAKEYYQVVNPKSPVEVNGTQYVTYLFDIGSIKETIYRAEAEMTVDNDYRVQTSYIYTDTSNGGYDTSGNVSAAYSARYWKTEAQADGNIKDHSNVTKITVRFGTQVASILYGADANFNYRGFKFSGEFVTNSNHYMYPDDTPGATITAVDGLASRKGFRYSEQDNAYYLISQKDWNRFGFSGEYFNMGKFYRPYLDAYYYNLNSGLAKVGGIGTRNNTLRMPFVTDNDDQDQYPDTMNVGRVMGYNVFSNIDPDGVFPGNDADHDGVSDNNKNSNDKADYDEPFMMFDADPDQFAFGNDFNNNGIPDFREDDNKMDLPYDLDRRGHHVSFRFTPVPSINLFVGSMRTHGVGSDNRTNSDYLKANLNYNVFDVGRLYAEYRHESIQDNITDNYVQVSSNMRDNYVSSGSSYSSSRFGRTYCIDEMEYKNSSVDRLFLDSNIRALPSVTLENSVKMERNHQIDGVTYENVYQAGQNINTLAMVNKVSLSRSFGNWQLNPGIKFRLYKKDFDEKLRSNEYYLTRIPVVTLKYLISSRTDITFGMQGIPGFPFRYTDFVANKNDFEQKTYILQLGNRTSYMGYQVWGGTGFQFDQKEYIKDDRSFENYKSTTTFLRVYLGY